MKIPNKRYRYRAYPISLARIVSEDSQRLSYLLSGNLKSSKDS